MAVGRLASMALLATSSFSLAFAQSLDLFSKAPPAIDEALKAQVHKFYQAHVDGKFRVAEQLVAEESKDAFFEAEKRRCRAFEVVRVNYEDGFNKASVVVNCNTEVMIPPAGMMKVVLPMSSRWKVENGEWHWHLPPRTGESPFGQMKPGEGDGAPMQIPSGPGLKELMGMVSVDRETLQLNVGGKGSVEEIRITNDMPGPIRLRLEKARIAPDLEAELNRADVAGKETAILTVRYTHNSQAPRNPFTREVFHVVVEPTNKVIPIQVQFHAPQE